MNWTADLDEDWAAVVLGYMSEALSKIRMKKHVQ